MNERIQAEAKSQDRETAKWQNCVRQGVMQLQTQKALK